MAHRVTPPRQVSDSLPPPQRCNASSDSPSSASRPGLWRNSLIDIMFLQLMCICTFLDNPDVPYIYGRAGIVLKMSYGGTCRQ